MVELSSHRTGGRSSVAAAVRRALRHGDAMPSLSALAMFMVLAAAPAQSQNAAETTELEEVVVTGIRQQLETSQARKEAATEILDSITAADIGALPDRGRCEW